MHPWLNWIEHRPPKAGIARSNRAGCATFYHRGVDMRFVLSLLILLIGLGGCNHVAIKPGVMETNSYVYADYGGYGMRRAIKNELEKRGHRVSVGQAKSSRTGISDDASIEVDAYAIPKNARYVVRVKERQEYFRPIWCSMNGGWWWRFNVSISDQKTGNEILSWFGHGCANSSVRLLNKILDELEIKE